jgi:glycosyltransferase involved in cell wall biosynthesis
MPRAQQPDTCVIIPAYNEQDSIGLVIRKLKKVSSRFHIVVVNDGSQDQTSQRAQALGVTVINLPFNLGIGGAVQTGLKYALRLGFNQAVQVDADGQHEPSELPKLLKAASQADLIIGSRFVRQTQYRGSSSRRFGIRFFSLLIRLVAGQSIEDPTSGFRVYNRAALTFLVHNYPTDFPEPESIVYLLKNGFVIKEVSVEMKPRLTGQSSLRSVRAIYLSISITLGILISAFKRNFVYVPNS